VVFKDPANLRPDLDFLMRVAQQITHHPRTVALGQFNQNNKVCTLLL
jgi:hypothetical protein